MGRTVPTFREEIARVVARWEFFGRALRREDRIYLKRIIVKARRNAAASSYAAFLNPVEGMMLSILMEQEKDIEELKNGHRF